MLIQITNHCTLNCPHCMHSCEENGQFMSEEVFKKALLFGEYSGCFRYNISGGEPTEHPLFEYFIELLSNHLNSVDVSVNPTVQKMYAAMGKPIPSFTIESNGEWCRDFKKTAIVKKILKDSRLETFQVCSIKGLYSNYNFINKYKKNIEKLSSKIYVHTDGIISMQDLGRARDSEVAQKQVRENKYNISCLNGCLLSKQISHFPQLSQVLFLNDQTCKPLIDWKGDVHWGESIFCSSYGNVLTDDFDKIWESMRKAKPCGKCALYKKLLNSTDEKIVVARAIMGL